MRRFVRSVVPLVLSALLVLQAAGYVDVTGPVASAIDDEFDLPPGLTGGPGPVSGDDGKVRAPPETVAGTPTTAPESGIDVARLERLIHEDVNDVRESRDLSMLERDSELAAVGRYHSRDMAHNQYVAHTAPDGETMGDRYDRFDYDCRVPTGDGRYAGGGENIYYAYYSGQGFTEEELAQKAVDGWMNSTDHRENLLRDYWEHEGIGVVVENRDGVTYVYVTQNFC
ncbi:CAP domain-containing protein [Haloarchaeobius sp. DFWS5]|uniref:CAP domain-containing protein n=1 Tax=Haloarchaeobius sp. DFWS5 TaxID=3446114 RepID=UPI003EBFDAA5